jgi:cytochrome b561
MEQTRAATIRYSRGAMTFHWVIALLIVCNFVLVWVAEDKPEAEEARLVGFHMAVGLTILALTVLRVAWRFMNPPPPFADTLKAWEIALAKVVHGLFYFLMVAIPLAGWGMVSSFTKGGPISWFGLFDVPALPVGWDKATTDVLHESHEVLAILMLVLIALHLAGALKHQFLDRDGTMARMAPWMRGR